LVKLLGGHLGAAYAFYLHARIALAQPLNDTSRQQIARRLTRYHSYTQIPLGPCLPRPV
jgi:hypothetical protein